MTDAQLLARGRAHTDQVLATFRDLWHGHAGVRACCRGLQSAYDKLTKGGSETEYRAFLAGLSDGDVHILGLVQHVGTMVCVRPIVEEAL